HYSREFETEADDYGVQLLRANGISPVKLAEMLEKLMHAHDAKRPQTPASEDSAEWTGYLESHPAPAERIRRLREAATE
ncbi:MAG: M48 family metalloprotease, partial [Pseudomonadota bacterium]|nr:M48 family metalloprotease [Pseudomonadota bacterium]